MADGSHLKIEKLWYLQNCLANFIEILHEDAYYTSGAYQLIQKSNLKKSKLADGPHLTMVKCDISATIDQFW